VIAQSRLLEDKPMRYYIYLLLDANAGAPFYVGVHAQETGNHSGLVLTDDHLQALLIDENLALTDNQRHQIRALVQSGALNHSPPTGYRVIVRDLVEHRFAELIRLALLASWREAGGLGPAVANEPMRFRPFDRLEGAHQRIEQFDPVADPNGGIAADNGQHPHGRYFVYALFDPDDANTIFYVGKGSGNRIMAHFSQAALGNELNQDTVRRNKLQRIAAVLNNRHQPIAATKILARTRNEDEAYLLETFYIKFILGTEALENATGGRFNDFIRARHDTTPRHGFEIPTRRDWVGGRLIKQDVFKGQGFDDLLREAAAMLNRRLRDNGLEELRFAKPSITGAGELSIAAPFTAPPRPIVLMMHIRSPHTRTFTCQTNRRGRGGPAAHQALWQELCDGYGLGDPGVIGYRRDHRFNPRAWMESNMAYDIETLVARAFLLCRLVMTPIVPGSDLGNEARQHLVVAGQA